MAKKSVLELSLPIGSFDVGNLEVTSTSKTRIVLTDATSDLKVIYQGKGFQFADGNVHGGEIDNILILDDNGKTLFSFTNVAVDLETMTPQPFINLLPTAYQLGLRHSNHILGSKGDDGLSGFLGDDVIFGGKGSDTIDPGIGSDVMTGGKGEDFFLFGAGYGKDRITDFDADGTDGAQDMIIAVFGDVVEIRNAKGNAVIDFGDGDTLTLIDVKAAQIDMTDFM